MLEEDLRPKIQCVVEGHGVTKLTRITPIDIGSSIIFHPQSMTSFCRKLNKPRSFEIFAPENVITGRKASHSLIAGFWRSVYIGLGLLMNACEGQDFVSGWALSKVWVAMTERRVQKTKEMPMLRDTIGCRLTEHG